MRYSAFKIFREGLTGNKGWKPVWREPDPKPEYDVIIVGAGGHGLATAYYLAKEFGVTNVAVLEKGAEVGAHILSGAVIETKALDELLPQWKNDEHPLRVKANQDAFWYLGEQKSISLPVPPQLKNHENYIISLGELCQYLAHKAESLGVEIFPGFTAAGFLEQKGQITGIQTGEFGLDKAGQPGANHQPGIEIIAKQVMFAEGCRGSVSKQIIQKYQLDEGKSPQTYGLGLKEVWRIPKAQHQEGLVIHTMGWPLDKSTYGGGFCYHWDDERVSIGFIVGLDYQNPYLSPYEEFQRFKTHPDIKKMLSGGERLSYGARALVEGGIQSLPKLEFPGGVLIGDAAGFLNVGKIKGTHMAMKSGMLAAESVAKVLDGEKHQYQSSFEKSWVRDELHASRNIRPGFAKGFYFGLLNAAMESYVLKGRGPWTFQHHQADHDATREAGQFFPIDYPKADGEISFDKLSSVYLTNTYHDENAPSHLKLLDPQYPLTFNLPRFNEMEARYCPAGVYEYVEKDGRETFQINYQNCIHCKTCDIKDPKQNIIWHTPQGGEGPNYGGM